MAIDPRAAIEEGAQIGPEVEIGPFAVIGSQVKLGRGTVVRAHAVIEGDTTLGENNWIGSFSTVGGDPQHVGYKGQPTALVIGDRNRIREYVTIHRGTVEGGGVTRIGSDNFLMVGVHIAHDCQLGDRIIMANLATLAGHVLVEDDVVFGGFTAVHQHARIGRAVMVAAGTKTPKDAAPFSLVGDNPPKFVGLNRVGLKRIGMSEEAKLALRKAYRLIFAKSARLEDGLDKALAEFGDQPEVVHLVEFIKGSKRGIIRD